MKQTSLDPTFKPNFNLFTYDKKEIPVNRECLCFLSSGFHEIFQMISQSEVRYDISETYDEISTLLQALSLGTVNWIEDLRTLIVLDNKYDFPSLRIIIEVALLQLLLNEPQDEEVIFLAYSIACSIGSAFIKRMTLERMIRDQFKIMHIRSSPNLTWDQKNAIFGYWTQRTALLTTQLDNLLGEDTTCGTHRIRFSRNFPAPSLEYLVDPLSQIQRVTLHEANTLGYCENCNIQIRDQMAIISRQLSKWVFVPV